jgi:putative sterol carrier protein
MTKTYDEQRRNRLADVVADYLGDEEVAAEKFCTELTQEVREWANYHKDQFNKANKILEQIDSNKIEWCHQESGISKNKEREYNLREAEYYNKRARLDAISKADNKDWVDFWEGKSADNEFDAMLSQYGYEYTPNLPNSH